MADGRFGKWRGEPVTAITTWTSEDGKINSKITNSNFKGDLIVSPEVFSPGQTWTQAANGEFDKIWRGAARSLKNQTSSMRTVYVRPAWEFNGDWFPWSVNSGNVKDFKKSWIRLHDIYRQEFPEAKLAFGVNKDNAHSDVPYPRAWPGDKYVDVLDVDWYDMYPTYKNKAEWKADLMRVEDAAPEGIGAHQAFAKKHGKPMGFGEWGLNHGKGTGGDNPFYIKKMYEFFSANAGNGPGQVLYETYFNSAHDGSNRFQIFPAGRNPNAAAMYRSLNWGKA